MKHARCPCGGNGRLVGLQESATDIDELYFCNTCGGRFTQPLPGGRKLLGVA